MRPPIRGWTVESRFLRCAGGSNPSNFHETEVRLNPSGKANKLYECKALTNYMKDHFAGSVAAIELLNHLISSHRGKTHEQFFICLRDEVVEDQEVLRGLLQDLDAEGGALRNTTAFLSEKLARIKLLLENPTGGQLARLEKLEALALGIEGKRTL